MLSLMQRGRDILYPHCCVACGEDTDQKLAICGACWGDTPICAGLVCAKCGIPLPGEDPNASAICSDCYGYGRPWRAGASVMVYDGPARRVVLSLKNHDRFEIAAFMSGLLYEARQRLTPHPALLALIPLHWRRHMLRKYNQAEPLSAELQRLVTDDLHIPDLLLRRRHSPAMRQLTFAERMERMENIFAISQPDAVAGKTVILVDDVMTSGATFSDATRACYAHDAKEVCILALARATKDA